MGERKLKGPGLEWLARQTAIIPAYSRVSLNLTKSATDSCSARSPGSIPAWARVRWSHTDFKALRSVLRRCANARQGHWQNVRYNTGNGSDGISIRAPDATLKTLRTRQRCCTITDSRP